jgi:hypothetical protein
VATLGRYGITLYVVDIQSISVATRKIDTADGRNGHWEIKNRPHDVTVGTIDVA